MWRSSFGIFTNCAVNANMMNRAKCRRQHKYTVFNKDCQLVFIVYTLRYIAEKGLSFLYGDTINDSLKSTIPTQVPILNRFNVLVSIDLTIPNYFKLNSEISIIISLRFYYFLLEFSCVNIGIGRLYSI